MHLFAYGTLMDPMIFGTVSRLTPRGGEPVMLYEFARWCVKGEVYPGVAPSPGGRVGGVLYRDLPETTWTLLDRFEGPEYERQTVQVVTADDNGDSCEAQVYVFRPEFHERLEERLWQWDDFREAARARFMGGDL